MRQINSWPSNYKDHFKMKLILALHIRLSIPGRGAGRFSLTPSKVQYRCWRGFHRVAVWVMFCS